ncbi:MAG: glycosyltransferase family 4 protein [Corynebacterium sp.]|uniref:glycosyltransferase family 4 protein n=1 Tax=Corynebacterium sp. TaxID=1720 RepID=UPI0026DB825F|nr:glycosyltransferase family 4 protein [Corynebacterium sp.]MDO4760914.1 glycosyltransferase family 4 protein [Corynebacterium sp.]
MKIAYVCVDPGIPVFGTKGASVHIQEVIREMRAHGHDVTVFATRRGRDVPADLATLNVVEIPVGQGPAAVREQEQIKASQRISQLIAEGDFECIYERYSLFSEVIADSSLPAILEVNAPLIDEQRTHRELVAEDYAYRALSRQVSAALATICVSEPVREWVIALTGATTVYTVANGVNVHRITPQPVDEHAAPLVVFVGTLKPWHGVDVLIEAYAHAQSPWRLRIIGDGPERENLERTAAQLGLDVEFVGAVAPEEIPAQLAGASIGVAPYPHDQAYFSPLKVYEYMAAGLAVVASEIGQIPNVLADVGILVPPSDRQALATAIDQLATNPTTCAELGARARARAVEKHSWSSVVSTMFALAGLSKAGR